jgi:hypothetical protein
VNTISFAKVLISEEQKIKYDLQEGVVNNLTINKIISNRVYTGGPYWVGKVNVFYSFLGENKNYFGQERDVYISS